MMDTMDGWFIMVTGSASDSRFIMARVAGNTSSAECFAMELIIVDGE